MARSLVASDDFNRDTGLGANWEQLNGTFNIPSIISDTFVSSEYTGPLDGGEGAIRWVGDSFEDDQYVKLRIQSLNWLSANYNLGVIARAGSGMGSSRTYYYFVVLSDGNGTYTTVLGKVVAGTNSTLASTTMAWEQNDTIELECVGTTITAMKNGTPLGGSFTATDSSISSGATGIIVSSDGSPTNAVGDDWEAGDITEDTSTDIEQETLATLTLTGNAASVELVTGIGADVAALVLSANPQSVVYLNVRNLVLTQAEGYELRDHTNAAVANLEGIIYEWYDDPDDTDGNPTDEGTFNTDGNGEATIVLNNSTLGNGEVGGLLLIHPSDPTIRGYYRVPVTLTSS